MSFVLASCRNPGVHSAEESSPNGPPPTYGSSASTPRAGRSVPVPPLFLRQVAGDASFTVAGDEAEALREKSSASIPGTPRSGNLGRSTPRHLDPTGTPRASSVGNLQRDPGLAATAAYSRMVHERKLQRENSATRKSDERVKLALRQHYHRERSRSPPPSQGGCPTPPRIDSPRNSETGSTSGRPAARVPIWLRSRSPSATEKIGRLSNSTNQYSLTATSRVVQKTFASSSHRMSYMPTQVTTAVRDIVVDKNLHPTTFSRGFDRTRSATNAPGSVTTASSTPRNFLRTTATVAPPPHLVSKSGNAGRSSPSKLNEAQGDGAPQPASAQLPAVSNARAQRLLSDFFEKLASDGVTASQWREYPEDRRNDWFARWRCSQLQRAVALTFVEGQ